MAHGRAPGSLSHLVAEEGRQIARRLRACCRPGTIRSSSGVGLVRLSSVTGPAYLPLPSAAHQARAQVPGTKCADDLDERGVHGYNRGPLRIHDASGHTGLAILLLASVLTVRDWFPAPRAEAFPRHDLPRGRRGRPSPRSGHPDLRAGGGRSGGRRRGDVTPAKVVCPRSGSPSVAPGLGSGVGALAARPPPRPARRPGRSAGPWSCTTPWARPRHRRGSRRPARDRAPLGRQRPLLCVPPRGPGGGRRSSNLRAVFVNTSGHRRRPHAVAARARRRRGRAPASPGPRPTRRTGSPGRAGARTSPCATAAPSYADALKMAFVHHTATENNYRERPSRTTSSGRSTSSTPRPTAGATSPTTSWSTASGRSSSGASAATASRDRRRAAGVQHRGRLGRRHRHVRHHGAGRHGRSDQEDSSPGVWTSRHVPPKGWAWMVSGGGPNTKYPEGQGVTLPVISGHRHTGYTSCPGDTLFNQLRGSGSARTTSGCRRCGARSSRPTRSHPAWTASSTPRPRATR